jgi:hypothetical protein
VEVVFADLVKWDVGENNKVARIAKEASVGKLTVAMIAKRIPGAPCGEKQQRDNDKRYYY